MLARMEIITRGDVSCVTLLWQRGSGWVLTIVCKAVFDLKPGEAALVSDPAEPFDRDLPGDPPFSRSLAGVNDRAPLKPRIDVVLTGHAHAPGNVPVRSLRTRLAFGGIDKTVEVVADRYFDRNGLLVEGAPFTRMPLVYELAAGGAGTWNPAGLPIGTLDGLGHMALPNLQPPDLPFPAPDAPFVPPTGFGPIAGDWPSRAQKLGRRSVRDLPSTYHGAQLADDFPRDYFQVAPEDQQLSTLPEDLTMTLENLIVGHPALTCWLPSIAPTILCEGALGTSSVMPSMDTLHIDTDAARCSVVWRGHLPRRDASEDIRVLVTLDNPRARLRTAHGTTGEHPRVVVPPPLPQTGNLRVDPPAFAGKTGEHLRVEPPTFAGKTGEHLRVEPPPLPKVPVPPAPSSARPQLPTAPLLDEDWETSDGFPAEPKALLPDRKSEPTRLFPLSEPPRNAPPDRKSQPTALFQVPEPPRAPPERKSQPTALYTVPENVRVAPPDRKSQPTALYTVPEPARPPTESPRAAAEAMHDGPTAFEASAAAIAQLTEIEADPESERDPFDGFDNPRDTIAPGFINPVGLPFPMPMPRPTPDPGMEMEASLGRTGAYPWGIGAPPGQGAAMIPPSARPSPPSTHVPPAPVSRPAQSGQTLPPGPLPGMEMPAIPAAAGVPAAPKVPAVPAMAPVVPVVPGTPVAPGPGVPPIPGVPAIPASPAVPSAMAPMSPAGDKALPTGDFAWGAGPRNMGVTPTGTPVGETIGMALSTGALALADARYEPADFAPTPEPEPARNPTLLLWFDADAVTRIRRAPQWRALLDELEKVPLDRDLDGDGGPREPWELEDRRDVFELCVRGAATNTRGCEEALSSARTRTGKVVPPIVLVEGELEIQLDELESLKAGATTVAPLVTPLDEGLRTALEAADSFMRRPGLSATPAVCEGLFLRIREAFIREKKTFSADYLDRQVERALLTGRHYQRRDVLGGPYFRAFLRVPGDREVLVTYLPDAVHKKVPMHRRFTARAIVEVHPQQDPYETRPLALRVLALARTT